MGVAGQGEAVEPDGLGGDRVSKINGWDRLSSPAGRWRLILGHIICNPSPLPPSTLSGITGRVDEDTGTAMIYNTLSRVGRVLYMYSSPLFYSLLELHMCVLMDTSHLCTHCRDVWSINLVASLAGRTEGRT